MSRMVHCAKFGKELPGLEYPVATGELGQRIYDNISAQAWELWKEQRTLLINHYGLQMLDPRAQDFLRQQMEEFFFGAGSQLPEGWTPPGASSGKGSGKGAPAPRRK